MNAPATDLDAGTDLQEFEQMVPLQVAELTRKRGFFRLHGPAV
jgi:hypothetical protein